MHDPLAIKYATVANEVVRAWVIPGGNEPWTKEVKARLRDDWPALWHAVEALAKYDGITPYTPEPAPPEVPLTGPEKAAIRGQWGPYANAREYADAQLANARHAAEHGLPDPEERVLAAREWAIVQTTGEVRQYFTEDDARRAMKTERGRVLLSRMPGNEWSGTK